ncbi:bifunctional lysylphosphatidylglycerol flippase/synthetase MprF [Inquilinus limosus]|uniref:bifunctional lysylphosphatidylglycerol flippase/synthetase MprF n=1 Tax=Inquilinus limosus TaxID=171674 RepID=UPI0003FB3B46|nr:bifunctional lysylphosphatidylglycerol flippase/synthetase MprF [Inquilinus limosus]
MSTAQPQAVSVPTADAAGVSDGAALRPMRQRLKPALLTIVTLLLFAGAAYAIRQELAAMSWHELIVRIRALPWTSVGLALLGTIGSFIALMGYDWSALRYVGARVPLRTMALASFCGYAVGNTIGGLVTASSVRYRVYTATGLEFGDIARVAGFCAMAFGFGIATVGAGAVLLQPGLLTRALGIHSGWTTAGAAAILTGAGLFLLACARRPGQPFLGRVPLPSFGIAAGQILISTVELLFAGFAFWVLLPHGSVPFGAFFVVFVVATVAGIISHVPGGVGVFESVMLLGLGPVLPPQAIAAALVVYRAVYFLIPVMLAVGILAGAETARGLRRLQSHAPTRLTLDVAGRLMPSVMAALIFVVGTLLLVSAATPTLKSRIEILENLPVAVVELSHILAAVTGLALLVVAWGLFRRLIAAYWLTLMLLAVSAVLALGKGFAWREALMLLLCLVIMLPCREEFWRRSALFDQPMTPGWLIALGSVVGGMAWLTFFSFRHVAYANDLWWTFEVHDEASRALRAMVAVSLLATLYGLWHLVRAQRGRMVAPTAAEIHRAEQVLRQQPRAEANLVRMGDKAILFSDSGRAFLMYAIHGRTWAALGDPVGAREDWPELIWRFREMTEATSGRPAYYGVRAETLPLYLDTGMTLSKLGEEARVPLRSFTLEGGSRKKALRYALSRGEKDGLTFEMVPAGAAAPLMSELAAVSDDWLRKQATKEKRFSLGAFIPDYVDGSPVALVRENGRLVAFATLLVTDEKNEVAIDLMRHTEANSKLVMEYLITKLIVHFKEQGYETLSLGMAPLSGLEDHPLAPLWHRIGRFVYRSGARFYNFEGLRGFKQKFDPVWEPRYLATPSGLAPALAISDIAALIGGGIKGLVAR